MKLKEVDRGVGEVTGVEHLDHAKEDDDEGEGEGDG